MRLIQSLAALIVFYKGIWQNVSIALQDTPEVLNFFKETWGFNSTEEVVRRTLSNTSFWESDLTRIEGLQDMVTGYVKELID